MSEADLLRAWKENPRRFVREVFGVTPDAWQDEVLAAFPRNRRLAMKACKGPGKTAVLASLSWNFLTVNEDPKIAATSVSADNLADNLWAGMAKWLGKCRCSPAGSPGPRRTSSTRTSPRPGG
jgi:phage terminase large subunit